MTEVPRLFTSGEVRRLVGISQRQLTYWNQSALIHPHGRVAGGRGSRRLYTMLDVVELKIIRRLRESGISLQRIRCALDFVADLPDEPAPLAELEILSDGRRVLVGRSDDNVMDALTGQYVLRLPLAELVAEVRDSVVPPQFTQRELPRSMAVGGRQP